MTASSNSESPIVASKKLEGLIWASCNSRVFIFRMLKIEEDDYIRIIYWVSLINKPPFLVR